MINSGANTGSTTANITAAPLTVTAQTDTRSYNGVTSSSVAPVITGTVYDSVTTAATQTFDTKNVGTGKTLTASGLVINDGNSGSNYNISYVTNTTGVITQANLTIAGIAANNKSYNGTTTATLSNNGSLAGTVFGSDTVTLNTSGISSVFADKDAGAGKTVTVSSYALGGADAANYMINSGANTGSTTANITQANLTVTGIAANNKSYNGLNDCNFIE